MKKIGFVDYYISEWHANNYPAWFEEACKELGLDYTVAYTWAEEDISPATGETTDEWCTRMQVERCLSLADLCEKSDVIVILAPSNPEKHLQYAKEVLPYGKPVYIDKTFAPDLSTAEEIIRIAEACGTPFFSSSALRYSGELTDLKGAPNVILTGGGSNLPEYIIHLVEMAVTLSDAPAQEIKVETLGKQCISTIVSQTGNQTALIYSPALPYTVTAENTDGSCIHRTIESPFFLHMIKDMLRFFETKTPTVLPKDTREVMKIRDAILRGGMKPADQ